MNSARLSATRFFRFCLCFVFCLCLPRENPPSQFSPARIHPPAPTPTQLLSKIWPKSHVQSGPGAVTLAGMVFDAPELELPYEDRMQAIRRRLSLRPGLAVTLLGGRAVEGWGCRGGQQRGQGAADTVIGMVRGTAPALPAAAATPPGGPCGAAAVRPVQGGGALLCQILVGGGVRTSF